MVDIKQNEQDSQVLTFPRLAVAGGGSGKNWFENLDVDTIIFVRPYSLTSMMDPLYPVVQQFHLKRKFQNVAMLFNPNADPGNQYLPVDMVRWSTQYQLVECLTYEQVGLVSEATTGE